MGSESFAKVRTVAGNASDVKHDALFRPATIRYALDVGVEVLNAWIKTRVI